MFDLELLKNEKINIISNDAMLEYRDEVEQVTVIITNQRFLIFVLPKDSKSFRFGRFIDNFKMNKMDMIFEIKLSDFDKYILSDTNCFYLHDDIIRNYLKNNNIVEE